MNKAILIGRLTREPEIRKSAGSDMIVGKYTLAVDRGYRSKDANANDQTADFINCTVFGKSAEFAEKYFTKGLKIAVVGRIQTGSYTNKEGQKVYTTDVIVESQEFVESKKNSENANSGGSAENTGKAPTTDSDGFMNIPEDEEEELPF